jgi:hypothetical protein
MTNEPTDKRRQPRLIREETLSVRPISDPPSLIQQAAIYCSTVDMSASGLQIRLDESLAKDQLVDVWIVLLGDLGTYHLDGRISWIRADGDEWLAGVELLTSSEGLADWQTLFS